MGIVSALPVFLARTPAPGESVPVPTAATVPAAAINSMAPLIIKIICLQLEVGNKDEDNIMKISIE